jgi:hypothetical protein
MNKQRIPTAKQVLSEQKKRAEAEIARRSNDTAVAVATAPAMPALPDDRTPVQAYLDEVAGGSFEGRIIKFTKEGKFVAVDDELEISGDIEFIALCDETYIGWIRFNGEGEAPTRHGGLLFDNFILPPRAALGDADPSGWPLGLDSKPMDPWKHEILLPLQRIDTDELYAFATMSVTGRRAVGRLLRSYERLKRVNADELPVTCLRTGGFDHKDSRIGWVTTPSLPMVRKIKRDSVISPAAAKTGTAEVVDEEIPS